MNSQCHQSDRINSYFHFQGFHRKADFQLYIQSVIFNKKEIEKGKRRFQKINKNSNKINKKNLITIGISV